MTKTPIFFGEQGLTETSANFIANLAKETLRKDELDIDSITFVHKQVSLMDKPSKCDLTLGMDENDCRSIEGKLEHIMKVKSLIAWLREAIKAKQKMHDKVESEEHEAFFKEWDKTHEAPKDDIEAPLTEEEYMNSLSIAERCKIFSLTTKAATIGKAIHENGSLAKAREAMLKAVKTPCELVKSGVNTLIYYYEPSLSNELVDEVYFKLQQKHREIQAELNAYLNKRDEAIRNSRIEYERKQKELEEYSIQYNNLRKRAWNEASQKRHKEINHLKIVIPKQLVDIYDEIKKLG